MSGIIFLETEGIIGKQAHWWGKNGDWGSCGDSHLWGVSSGPCWSNWRKKEHFFEEREARSLFNKNSRLFLFQCMLIAVFE